MTAVHQGRSAGLLTAVAVLLCGLAVLAPVNHDESQYLAAARLASTLTPFVDFLHLQPPYQIYVFAPVMALFPEHGFLALRIVTALLGMATVLLTLRGMLLCGVSPKLALRASLGILLCYPFLFSVTLVRNDALPAVALSLAVLCVLARGGQVSALMGLIAGLVLGFAIGVKLSYAFPALGLGLALIFIDVQRWRQRREVSLASLACLIGGLAALAPLVSIRAGAPDSFDFGLFTFGMEGPHYWYALNGFEERLSALRKIGDFVAALVVGPGLIALIAAIAVQIHVWRRSARGDDVAPSASTSNQRLLLIAFVLAGCVAAFAPTPTWRQYLVPMLPPLAIWCAILWQDHAARILIRWPLQWRRVTGVVAVVSVLSGAIPVCVWLVRSLSGAWVNPVGMTREAHWVGDQLSGHGSQDRVIVTLAPQAVVDSGVSVDPGFAAGPFAYRSAPIVDQSRWQTLHLVGAMTLPDYVRQTRPTAILVGYEDRATMDRIGLDRDLRRLAQSMGWRSVRSPFGRAELFVSPREPK